MARSRRRCHDSIVAAASTETALGRGYEALASGNWERARDSFQEALDSTESAEALDGLGRALWRLRDERGAVVHRERAYAGFRRDGEPEAGSRVRSASSGMSRRARGTCSKAD
jgi:hypothetical protein